MRLLLVARRVPDAPDSARTSARRPLASQPGRRGFFVARSTRRRARPMATAAHAVPRPPGTARPTRRAARRDRAGSDDRGPEPRPVAGDGRRRGRLRHPRRRDPAGVRPAVRLASCCATSWSATSRAPATPPRATRRPPAGSASAWRPAGRARPTSSRRSPTPTWTRVPIVAITGQVPSAAIGTDAFQEADIVGITMPITKHNYLVTDPDDIPRTIAEAFHIAAHRPARPGAGRHLQGRPAGARPRSRGRPSWTCPATGRRPGRTPSRSARRPG